MTLLHQHAVAMSGEALSSHKEHCHPVRRDHLRLLVRACVDRARTLRNLADVTGRPSLAPRVMVDARSALYSPARVGGLASGSRRLARLAVSLQRRTAVHGEHLAERRRGRGCVAVVAAGAAVSGLEGLVAGRRLVERVGIAPRVWSGMTTGRGH